MSFRSRFCQFVAEHALLAPGAAVVVGVSGGKDSAVLLDVLLAEGYAVTAAHVNYGLRGADSDADEELVRAVCRGRDVPLHVERVTVYGSVQDAARTARYDFFGRVAASTGATAIATAHHRDDQAETLLLHLFRGAGLRGLAGMPVRRPLAPDSAVEVVRPLLWARRKEIDAYAFERFLKWREDASNATEAYARNVVRHAILPLVAEHFGDGVVERIAHTADLVRDSQRASEEADAFEAAVADASQRALRLATLAALPTVRRQGVLLEALRRWAPDAPRSAATVSELDALLHAQPGRRIVWPVVTVWRERDTLVFVPAEEGDPYAPFPVAVGEGETDTPFGTLRWEPVAETDFDASPLVEVLDADRLGDDVYLRPWQEGDAFQPLGMGGTKRVSDLLTDRRVPAHRRAEQLVLVAGGEVVWVVGHRLAASVGVDASTRRAVRLVWNPAEPLARS